MSSPRRRLDTELVRRGLVASRGQAQVEIEAGRVTVAGAPATKAARLVAPGDPVVLRGPGPRFVSRGGEKLDAALDRFAIDVTGRHALDAGASTGGFTDCLLQRGAAAVVAIDVGYGQLHERLRADARVDVRERTNVRHLQPGDLPANVDLVVADLSFISLRTVLPALVGGVAAGAELVLLVKPQFEAGRQETARGRGIISDPAVWRRVLEEVGATTVEAGAVMMGAMVSPLRGADGNVEFFFHARTTRPGAEVDAVKPVDLDAVVDEAVVATSSPVSDASALSEANAAGRAGER